jgi:hypothetical protein
MAPHEHKRVGDQDLTYCTYLYIFVNTICREEVPCVVRRCERGHDDTSLFAPANPHVSNYWWGKLQTSAASLNLPGAYFTWKLPGSPVILLTVEGHGARWFVALRCCAEECAISLSIQAQDHALDLAEYKRVEPAHCPTGATSGGTGGERKPLWAYHPHCFIMRTRLVLCMTEVLELDFTTNSKNLTYLPNQSQPRFVLPK